MKENPKTQTRHRPQRACVFGFCFIHDAGPEARRAPARSRERPSVFICVCSSVFFCGRLERNRAVEDDLRMASRNSFNTRTRLSAGGSTFDIFSLAALERAGFPGVTRLPFSLKILLENLLR